MSSFEEYLSKAAGERQQTREVEESQAAVADARRQESIDRATELGAALRQAMEEFDLQFRDLDPGVYSDGRRAKTNAPWKLDVKTIDAAPEALRQEHTRRVAKAKNSFWRRKPQQPQPRADSSEELWWRLRIRTLDYYMCLSGPDRSVSFEVGLGQSVWGPKPYEEFIRAGSVSWDRKWETNRQGGHKAGNVVVNQATNGFLRTMAEALVRHRDGELRRDA